MSDQELPAGVVVAVKDYRRKLVRARESFVLHCTASTKGQVDEAARTDVIRQRDTAEMMAAEYALRLAIEAWR
jgi:hypothetical protein